MKTVIAWAVVIRARGGLRLSIAHDQTRKVRGYGVMVTRAEAQACIKRQTHPDAEAALAAVEVAVVPVRWWNRRVLRWLARRGVA